METRAQVPLFLGKDLNSKLKWSTIIYHWFLTHFALPTDHLSLPDVCSILYWAWWPLGSPFCVQRMSVPCGGSLSVARHLGGRDSNIWPDNALAIW